MLRYSADRLVGGCGRIRFNAHWMSAPPAILSIAAARLTAVAAVGSYAARGAMWTLLFSALTKLMTLGSQIALAWFLVPEEFGLVAMTLSVMSFTAIVGGATLKNILVQRGDRFDQQAGQVFWLALTLNAGAALFLALFSPLAGILFDEPRVVSLILVASLAPAIQSLSTIYLAALQRDLKFRQVAMIQCGASTAHYGSAVLLAWLGAGALALVFPFAITAVGTAITYRLSAGRIPLGRPDPERWRSLGAPVWWLMINALFSAFLASGACMIIGLIQRDPAIIGFYYWGFSIASQAVFLLVNNLQGVLFPALSKLYADAERQFGAAEKAARTLLVVVTPICVLQWLLARPLVSALFHSRWQPAIPVVEWISIGLLSQPLYLLSVSALLARGRFRRLALTTGLVAAATLAGAGIGAITGDQTDTACGAAIALLFSNLAAGWLTFHEFGRGLKELLALVAPLAVMGSFVAALGWWASRATSTVGPAIQIFATGLAVLGSSGLLVRFFLPQLASDVAIRLRGARPGSRFVTPATEALERIQP
jgi:teichuronic acid exporter